MSSTGAAGGGITAAHCSAQITTQGKPLASLKQVFTTPTELLAAVSPPARGAYACYLA